MSRNYKFHNLSAAYFVSFATMLEIGVMVFLDSLRTTNYKLAVAGERKPHGYVLEEGKPYRLGAAYVGYKNYRVGIDSDRYVRHPIQDIVAHHLVKKQPGFKSYSNAINGYFQYQSYNQFILW